MSEFDDLFKLVDSQQDINAEADRMAFEQKSPTADILDLAKKTGLPLDVVERNSAEVAAKASAIDYDKIRAQSPVLATFLTNPENKAYAADEIEMLSAQESETRGMFENTLRGVGERTATLAGNLLGSAESLARIQDKTGIKTGVALFDQAFNVFDLVRQQTDVKDIAETIADTKMGYKPKFDWDRLKGDVTVKNLSGYIAEQGIISVPDMVFAMASLPTYILSRTEEIARARGESAGTESVDQFIAAMPAAVVSATLERIGAKALLGKSDLSVLKTVIAANKTGLKATGKKIAASAAIEGATEFLQENIEYAGETIGVADYDPAVGLERGFAAAVAGSGMGGAIRTITATAENFQSASDTMEGEQQTLGAFLKFAKSQLKTKNPKVLSAYVEDLAADMGVETVYVDAEAVQTLNQEMRDDYLQERLDAANADVEIPMHEFVNLSEEAQAALTPHARLNPGSVSQMEIVGGLNLQAMVVEAEQDQANHQRAQEVYSEVSRQLVETGAMSPEKARQSAVIIPAYVTTKAQREGMTVDEVYSQMGLSIEPLVGGTDNPPTNSSGDPVTMNAQSGVNDSAGTTSEAATQGFQDERGIPGESGILEQQGGQTGQDGRYADLEGLETEVEVDGQVETFGAIPQARDAAQAYAERAGLEYNPPRTYAKVSRKRAERIAQAFEDAVHDPSDPEVAAAYQAMIEETLAQYEVLLESGLVVEFIDFDAAGDPYESSPRKAIMDVRDNNHMWVFSTRDGFGSDATFDVSQNPLLQETAFEISGQPALANDIFRVVHDYFGHVKDGVGFRARGEENAWRSHAAMYSPLALRAMTMETRGQNSWVNYGPHGAKNRSASSADTVFADQKIALLPEWVSEEGATDPVVLAQSPRESQLEAELSALRNEFNDIEFSAQQRFNESEAGAAWRAQWDALRADDKRDEASALLKSKSDFFPEDDRSKIEGLRKRIDGKQAKLAEERNKPTLERNSLGMYSGAEKAAIEMKMPGWKEGKSLPGDQIWNKLKKTEGVKADELSWMGLEEFLMAGKVNQTEVLAFIRNNGVTVEETVATESETESEEEDVDWDEEVIDFEDAEGRDYIEERIDEQLDQDRHDLMPQWIEDNIDAVKDHYREEFGDESVDSVPHGHWVDGLLEVGEGDKARDVNVFVDLFDDFQSDSDIRDGMEDLLSQWYYEGSPQYVYSYRTQDGTDYEIKGSDDFGYSLYREGRYLDALTDVYSVNEAQLQALYTMSESGDLQQGVDEDDESVIKFESWLMPGDYDNYREVKLKLPEIEGDFYEHAHFPDRNIVAFQRVTDRKLEIPNGEPTTEERYFKIEEADDGFRITTGFPGDRPTSSRTYATREVAEEQLELGKEKAIDREVMTREVSNGDPVNSYHIEENQSDWHQQGRKRVYEGQLSDEDHMEIGKAMHAADRALEAIRSEARKNPQSIPDDHEVSEHPDRPESRRFQLRDQDGNRLDSAGSPDELKVLYSGFYSPEAKAALENSVKAHERYQKSRDPVPNAPFKKDEWMRLSLKRAIINAVEEGKDAVSWSDGDNRVEYWGENQRELFENTYDKKMPSLFKKITKIKPVHVRGKGGAGHWVAKLTPELIASVKADGYPLFQKNRAQILLYPNRRVIQLGEASDLSSFFHESGHLFLEMERKFSENGSDRQKADFKKILDWMGVEEDSQITTEHHEMFARAFEKYIGEGKAPSIELRDFFRKFAEWIKQVYQSLTALDVDLTDDIRGVMDRMIATDEQIDRASAAFGYDPDGENDGEQEGAKEKAKESLREKVIRQLRRKAKREWQEEAASIAGEVQANLEESKLYRAISRLKEAPLNYEAVLETLELENLKEVRKLHGLTKKTGEDGTTGADPDLVAETLGYSSAQQMLEEIVSSPTLKQAVDAEVERAMLHRHGDILNDGTIEREADAAVHSEDQAKVLLAQLKTLDPRSTIDRAALKQYAKEQIGKMGAALIKPKAYHRAEVKAAQRYAKALAEGDTDSARKYKIEQLRQFYLFREALAAEAKVEKMRKYLKAASTRDYKSSVVAPEYAQNIRVLTKLYDMRKGGAQLEMESLVNWLMAQMNDPNQMVKPQILDMIAARVIEAKDLSATNGMDWRQQVEIPSYKTMTVDEMQGVYDMARHLRWLGGRMAGKEAEKRKMEAEGLADSIDSLARDDVAVPEYKTKTAGFTSGLKRFMADHVKLRNMILALDGHVEFGLAQRLIFQPIVDATNAEVKTSMDYAKRIEDIWKPMNARLSKGSNKRTITREDGTQWTLPARERIMLLVYYGSPESREAIYRGHNVTQLDVAKMLQFATQEDMDFAEKIWALNESLWPQFSAMNAKVFGVVPPKVEHAPFTLNGRKMKGGYMRLYYDWSGKDASRRDVHGGVGDFLASGQAIAMSKSGAAIARVGSGGRRVALEPGNIFTGLQDAIHAIHFTEASIQVSRLINREEFVNAFDRKFGPEKYQSFKDNLEGIFLGTQSSNGPIVTVMKKIRTNMSIGLLGFSVRNFVQQPIAITNVMGRVGELETISAALKFFSNPIEQAKFVKDRSVFMQNRTAFVNREVMEHLGGLNAGKGGQIGVWLKKHAFDMQTFGDGMVAYPAWLGAYKKGQAQFNDDTKAALYADEIVAATVGSGLNKDLSAIMQGSGGLGKSMSPEFARQLTFMGSFFNVVFGLMEESYQRNNLKSIGGFGQFVREQFWFLAAPAVLSQMVVMSLPSEDDDEGIAEWMAKAIAEYGIGTVFMLRDLAGALKGFDASIPGQAAPGGVVKIGKEAVEAVEDGEMDLKDAIGVIRGVMPLIPIPGSGQVARFLDYMHSYEQGDEGDFNLYQAAVEGRDKD